MVRNQVVKTMFSRDQPQKQQQAEMWPYYSSQLNRARLIVQELETLYQVGSVLNSPLILLDKLQQVLNLLHEMSGLCSGLIAIRDRQTGALDVYLVRSRKDQSAIGSVRYEPGEGLMCAVMEAGGTLVIERLANESRFLGKLGLYDVNLPFICAPIRLGDDGIVGVLAAQPANRHCLNERARFMEMVANLIAENVEMLRTMQQRISAKEQDAPNRCLHRNYSQENIAGRTPAMLKLSEQVRQVAKWKTTVLLRGESGTGKELIANGIHYNSACADGPFIKLNCPALADNLLESELFGHEKGAFSGALQQRKGRFELADHGTIFLDEIGEISPDFQAKLLRVLQEGEFERIGGNRTLKVQVRIIAATNRNLEEAVREGRFREDLYYRLNVMPIYIPPLRDRLDDIPELVRVFLARLSKRQGGRRLEIKESAIRQLRNHDWPGNVRELENILERASIMSQNGMIDRETISLTGFKEQLNLVSVPAVDSRLSAEDMAEREKVIAALEEAGWVQAKAARLLNMTPRKIAYRVKTMNIRMKYI